MTSVFHICSDYAKQSLYGDLLRAVSARSIDQFMYVPVRTAAELDVGRVQGKSSIDFRYSHLLSPIHRLLFRTKVRKVLADIMANTSVKNFELVHAHFLYSDGAVARAIHRRYGLPYLVAVRNSDLNYFMRLRPDLCKVRDDILRHASLVIFLSPAYLASFLARLPAGMRDLVARKAQTIPNGIAEDWLTDPLEREREPAAALRLLYVGDFTPNKNVAGIVAALRLLQQERQVSLTVVGGGADRGGSVQRLLQAHEKHGINYVGRVVDRERLKSIYLAHDVFVMPSFHETFGLAYIEALSQGVPVVCSQAQGIDGYFERGTIAAAVDPSSPTSIAEGIRLVAARLPASRKTCMQEAHRFGWTGIGQVYERLYRQIIGKSS